MIVINYEEDREKDNEESESEHISGPEHVLVIGVRKHEAWRKDIWTSVKNYRSKAAAAAAFEI